MEFLTEWPPPQDSEKVNTDDNKNDDKPPEKKRRKKTIGNVTSVSKLLASWWRSLPPESRHPDLDVQSNVPYARLVAISKRPKAREYLRSLCQGLQPTSPEAEEWQKHYTLATVHMLQKEDKLAFKAASYCLRLCQLRQLHDVDSISDRLAYVKGLSQTELEIVRIATLAHLQLQASSRFEGKASSEKTRQIIEVVHAKNWTRQAFFQTFILAKRPVVIEGLQLTPTKWTLESVKSLAGDKTIPLRYAKPDSTAWARLEECSSLGTKAKKVCLGEFIDNVKNGIETEAYLFDWSLPLFCPELSSQFTVPEFFEAENYLKKKVESTLYHQSWPSLFISPPKVVSDLHIDAFGSNFYMALFEGRKRWTFFPPEVSERLKMRYYDNFDPVFDIDWEKDRPLWQSLSPYNVTLEAGQVLFVPAGCPHRVENLEATLAVSGNFVDNSNIKEASEHLIRQALIEPRAAELVEEWIGLGLLPAEMPFEVVAHD